MQAPCKSAAHKLPHERIVRLKGHAALYAFGNGVCVKPTCRCGWIGYAAPKTAARHQYIGHLHATKAVSAKGRHPRIEHWDDERGIGNSLIVTLRPGWRFEDIGEHVRGFDTVVEAMRDTRNSVPCACEVCAAIAKATGGEA